MIEQLVPYSVAAVSTRLDLTDAHLFPREELAVGRAVKKRRREFVTGRVCARRALGQLGIGSVEIPAGERGEPVWPSGVRGSITHCRGYRACAVAWAGEVSAVGIDAEAHEPLPRGVLEQVAFGRERAIVAGRRSGVCLDRLLFSAKEAVYKAWFPLAGRWLGFEDVEMTLDLEGGTFRARLLVPGPVVDGSRLTELWGRWAVEHGIVATAVVLVPRTSPDVGSAAPRFPVRTVEHVRLAAVLSEEGAHK